MLTVAILINGNPIMARSAVNTGTTDKLDKHEVKRTIYKVDDGSSILHDPDDGAVALAKKLLDTIVE